MCAARQNNIITTDGARDPMSTAAPGVNCPSCSLPFDRSQRRCLIDSCGHQRCFTCIFQTQTDLCPLCLVSLTGTSSASGGSSPTKVSRVVSQPTTSSKSSSSSLQRSLTKSISTVVSGKSLTEREASNISHESGFFSAVGNQQGLNQTFPRRRKNASRTSLLVLQTEKMSSTSEEKNSISGSASHVNLPSSQPSLLALKPPGLHFEIPRSPHSSTGLVGRQWVSREIQSHLLSHLPTNRGVIIRGGPGSGKTELIFSIVEKSVFGRTINATAASLLLSSPQSSSLLSSSLVAYHFCQADNSPTCLVPEFLQSLAGQLCQAPQLTSYHHLLQSQPDLLAQLTINNCHVNPSQALRAGILEPLSILYEEGKVSSKIAIILIDGLCEAEQHRPDYGETLTTFLAKHYSIFPPWLKIVATVRSNMVEIVNSLPFHQISLDNTDLDERLNKDVSDLISSQLPTLTPANSTPALWRKQNSSELATTEKLSKFLTIKAKGCVLYVKLILDMIGKGTLNLKSSSFKSLPQSLSEIYHLTFSLLFPTAQSFELISQILSIALAVLQPVSLDRLFHIFSALHIKQEVAWNEFQDRYRIIADFLVTRSDGTLMFFHPTLREWLLTRREGESTKFLCDPKLGHAAIAYFISREATKLRKPESVLELIHHLLKANVNKITETDSPYSNKDLQASFLCLSTVDVSGPLGSTKNIFSPILKVSRLLLLAGADPNTRTELEQAPGLVAAHSRLGHTDMVSLLLEFGADPNLADDVGLTALSEASAGGHLTTVQLLLQCGARLTQSAVVRAARAGHLQVLDLLLLRGQDWSNITRARKASLEESAQQAFVASINTDHLEVAEFLFNLPSVNINKPDSLSLMTPISAAVRSGARRMVEWVVKHKAVLEAGIILEAAEQGQASVTEYLVREGARLDTRDGRGRTALMIASSGGHSSTVESLVREGAGLEDTDQEGLTPLTHAVISGHSNIVSWLLARGANVNTVDSFGRSPLDVAIYQGSAEMVEMLLENGANMEKLDDKGVRPLDRVIGFANAAVVTLFLRKGAKLGPGTWMMAAGKPEIQLILLNKLLEDGNILYRKNHLSDASHRYRYALKRIPQKEEEGLSETFSQIHIHLLLNLSRCERRQGHYHEAAYYASSALAAQPGCGEGYIARAKANHAAGKLKEALFDFYHGLEVMPASKEIRKAILRLKEEIGSENLTRLPGNFGSAESLVNKQCDENALEFLTKCSSKS